MEFKKQINIKIDLQQMNGITKNVNRLMDGFVQTSDCMASWAECGDADNMGYTAIRDTVLRMTVLYKVEHLCFVLKFSGNNPALHVSQNR